METFTLNGVAFRAFDHLYAVSEAGLVLRKRKPFLPSLRSDGYVRVGKSRLLHRMVATCWHVKPEGRMHVHHLNEDKQDNRACNLEWISPQKHISEHHPDLAAGHTMSEAGKQSLRAHRLGSVTSEETKQKQREASLRLGCKPPPRPVGTKLGPEAIAKMRANSPNAAACEIHGVRYHSFSEAGRALGQKPHTLRKRCLSPSFPDYKALGAT